MSYVTDLAVALRTVATVTLVVFVPCQQAYVSMLSSGRILYGNVGPEDTELDCDFDMDDFSMFVNPIFWTKRQLEEEPMQINFMGNILPPFFGTGRFRVNFTMAGSQRYNPKLILLDLSLEDSGNYTCEVHGRKSVVLASVTHAVYVRASLQEVYFANGTSSSSTSSSRDDAVESRDLPSSQSSSSSYEYSSSSSSSSSSTEGRMREMTFVAGVPQPVRCVSVGGYPPPRLHVYLGVDDITDRFTWSHSAGLRGLPGLRLMTYRSERQAAGLVLTARDDGQWARCLAVVADFGSQISTMLVRVNYAPIVSCASVSASVGDRDVCLACEVRARPDVSALYWVLDSNGTTLAYGSHSVLDDSWVVVLIREDQVTVLKLCIRRVRIERFRQYVVVAENRFGAVTQTVELLHDSPELGAASAVNADHHQQSPDAEQDSAAAPERSSERHHHHLSVVRSRSPSSSSSSSESNVHDPLSPLPASGKAPSRFFSSSHLLSFWMKTLAVVASLSRFSGCWR